MKYHTLYYSKIRKDVVKYVVCCSCDWRFKTSNLTRFCCIFQVQEPVFKDHAEPQKPLVDEANLKFRPIMPEDVVQQVMPQAHDDSVKKEQIDHPLVDHQVST